MKKSAFSIFNPQKSFPGFSVFLTILCLFWASSATALVVKWDKYLPVLADSNIAVGPNHSLYVTIRGDTSTAENEIRRILPNGSSGATYHPPQGVMGTPVIAPDGTIYIRTASAPHKIIALTHYLDGNLTPDFHEKWVVHIESGTAPSVGYDGTIYYVIPQVSGPGTGAKLFALNPDDGSTKWVCTLSDKDCGSPSSPMIAPDGTIYITMNEMDFSGGQGQLLRKIFAVRPNGILKWQSSFPNRVSLHLMGVGSDGTLYIKDWMKGTNSVDDTSFGAIDPADGSIKWSLPFFPTGNPHSHITIGPDNTIYLAGMDRNQNKQLLFVNPDGTIKHTIPLPDTVQGGPTMGADGSIYIVSNDNYLRAINSHTGGQKWAHYIPNVPQKIHPVIAPDGTIYVGGSNLNNTILYALESDDAPCLDCVWASFRGNNRLTGEGAKSALTARLITPQNFQEISLQNATNANFQWKPMGGNPTYRLELSVHPSFPQNPNNTASDEVTFTDAQIDLTNFLITQNAEYFWRVKALTPDALYSPYRSFVYGDKTQMVRPIIKSPAYDAVLKSPVHLEWEHQGATNYRVLILTEPVWRPDTIVHDQIIFDTHLDKEFTTYRTYYMVIQSNAPNGPWSLLYKFKVISGN